jgi:hypothetical protein
MLVQDFLREHDGLSGLAALKEKFGISYSEKYDDIVVLNYSQIDSQAHKHNPLVKECRGLILEKGSFNVVARSFDRFLNYGECPDASKYDITKAKVQEKLDGSLVTAYWRYDKWNFATRRMAFAEGENAFGVSFRQVIDKAFDVKKLNECNHYHKCFVFELTSPETRVVKRYADYRLNLIGIRERDTGYEISSKELDWWANWLGVPRPKQYSMASFEEVVKNSKELPELDEGYVCLWEPDWNEVAKAFASGHAKEELTRDFYRLKIKNPAYLAVAHMRDNGEHSEKRVITIVMMGEQEEYLSYFPEDRPLFQKYVDAHEKMKEDVARTWEKVKWIENQKEFALLVKDLPVSGILFRMKKGDKYEEIVDKMTDNSKINIFRGYMR